MLSAISGNASAWRTAAQLESWGKDQNPDGVSGIVLLLRGKIRPVFWKDFIVTRTALNEDFAPDVKWFPIWIAPIWFTTTTVSIRWWQESGLVIVLILFLGSPRSADRSGDSAFAALSRLS